MWALEAACWTKYPYLKHKSKRYIGKSESDGTNEADDHMGHAATTLLVYGSRCSWVIASGATVQRRATRHGFSKWQKVNLTFEMDDLPSVKGPGTGTVHLKLSVNGTCVKFIQESFLDVPDPC